MWVIPIYPVTSQSSIIGISKNWEKQAQAALQLWLVSGFSILISRHMPRAALLFSQGSSSMYGFVCSAMECGGRSLSAEGRSLRLKNQRSALHYKFE